MADDLERAREWLEWVYVNGRGAPADHANELIEFIDDQDWHAVIEDAFDRVVEIADYILNPTTESDIIAIVDHVGRELALLADIREALTNAGAIDDTSDIPATLRLLLGP